jgi:hypothetical protein
MTPLRALLVAVLVLFALVGTAGLTSLEANDACWDHWNFQETDTRGTARPISVWPPGLRCQLVAADGTVIAEREMPGVGGYLVLLALELMLLVAVLRARRPPPAALRAAAIATLGLLTWGVAALWLDAVGGATVTTVYLLFAIVGVALLRGIRRAGRARADLLLAVAAPWTGLFVWGAFGGPLAHPLTVALLAGVAVAGAWVERRLAPRPSPAT